MRSEAETVEEYLASLPEDRREALEAVRRVILERLPRGYEETMRWGMISYEVPLETYAETYNGQPLGYAALASQQRHMTLYLNSIYSSEERAEEFEQAYRATGKRYDVGKSCVRFRRLEDLPLDLIGDTIASDPPEAFIRQSEAARKQARDARKRG